MKKILLSISLLIGLSSFAQVAFTENCTDLTVGNIGTVTNGSVAGQHNWYTTVQNEAVPAGANTDFQIVDFGSPNGKGIQIKGSTAANVTTPAISQSRILSQYIDDAWSNRTDGNDITELQYDFNTGPVTTSVNTFRTYIFDSNNNTAVAGYYYTPSTNTLAGWIYYNNGTQTGYFTVPLGSDDSGNPIPMVLESNTWYTLGVAYNYNTGEVIWKSTGLFYLGGIEGADPGVDITKIGFQVNSGTGSNSGLLFDIDNIKVKFTDVEDLLGVKQNSIVANKLSVYPNPAKDMITVSNNEIAINGIEISDINGRIVKTMKASGENNVQVNISDLSQGVYMMKIDSDQGTVTKKVIKE